MFHAVYRAVCAQIIDAPLRCCGSVDLRCGLTFIFLSCSSDHLSIVIERTNEMCTPSPAVSADQGDATLPRCTPEHSRQMNVPYETEAHWGEGALQSTHSGGSVSDCTVYMGIAGSPVRVGRRTHVCWRPSS